MGSINACAATETSSQSVSSRSRFTFQNNWFEQIIPFWETSTSSLREPTSKPLRILELGSFEGASTTWILENLANHPSTTMTVIDTFGGGMEHDSTEVDSLEARFRANVNQCTNVDKLRIIKARTEDGLVDLRKERAKFDFIYIDASHVAIDVLHDAVLCWAMLDVGGMLVFDDWTWKGYMEDTYNPRMAILAFLQCAGPEVKVIARHSQIWITRVENCVLPTKNPDPALYYWDDEEVSLEADPLSKEKK